ncbi:hypothetical protein GGI12_000741 [Dipsacomyces acuminosporus]|nr:hypothetical protein GGI12_000741 [Dipsacomyces acuminosporus]
MAPVDIIEEVHSTSVYYGADDEAYVDTVDDNGHHIVLRMLVEGHHINGMGVLDEGLVATIADNHTSMLLATHSLTFHPERMPVSVSVCLSAHSCAPIKPNTEIEVVCSVAHDHEANPHSEAIFRDANDPSTVYATATHTKHVKDVFQNGGKL